MLGCAYVLQITTMYVQISTCITHVLVNLCVYTNNKDSCKSFVVNFGSTDLAIRSGTNKLVKQICCWNRNKKRVYRCIKNWIMMVMLDLILFCTIPWGKIASLWFDEHRYQYWWWIMLQCRAKTSSLTNNHPSFLIPHSIPQCYQCVSLWLDFVFVSTQI